MPEEVPLCTLPITVDEVSRLDLQHRCVTLVLGGLYYPSSFVEEAISMGGAHGKRPAILDAGTGTGAWAEGMAKAFPNADVTAGDLAPPVPNESTPSNCHFIYEDINNGFSHPDKHFDVVHMRMVNHGTNDFEEVIHNAAKILRPGGALVLGTAVIQVHDEQGREIPMGIEGEEGWCALQAIYTTFRNAGMKRTASADASYHWGGWLRDNPMYELCGEKDFLIPFGGWKIDSPRDVEAGKLYAENIKMALQNLGTFIVASGAKDEETTQRWMEAAKEELDDPMLHRSGGFRCAWATRLKTEWRPWERTSAAAGVGDKEMA